MPRVATVGRCRFPAASRGVGPRGFVTVPARPPQPTGPGSPRPPQPARSAPDVVWTDERVSATSAARQLGSEEGRRRLRGAEHSEGSELDVSEGLDVRAELVEPLGEVLVA